MDDFTHAFYMRVGGGPTVPLPQSHTFVYIELIWATKKSRIFKYRLPEDFLSKGQKTTGGMGYGHTFSLHNM